MSNFDLLSLNQPVSNPLSEFVSVCVMENEKSKVSMVDVVNEYNVFCNLKKIKPMIYGEFIYYFQKHSFVIVDFEKMDVFGIELRLQNV